MAKEAAKAIRKVIKYGVSEYQFTEPEKVMGMKIWLLGCTNSPPKGAFRGERTPNLAFRDFATDASRNSTIDQQAIPANG